MNQLSDKITAKITEKITDNSIDRFLHAGLLILGEKTKAIEAARAMHERSVGCVIVCNKTGEMCGLVTDRDIATHLLAFGYSPDTPLSDFMSAEIYKLTEDATLTDVIHLMEKYAVRRIPIVRKLKSEKERCVGMVTLDDLIEEKSIGLDSLSRITSQQIINPMRRRYFLKDKTSKGLKRRSDRNMHNLNRFYEFMSTQMKLKRSVCEDVTFYLLSELTKRLPATGAAQMVSQLPVLLREKLLDLRAGPDRTITGDSVLAGLMSRFNMNIKVATVVIENFWDGIEKFTKNSGETKDVLAQLPEEFRQMLV